MNYSIVFESSLQSVLLRWAHSCANTLFKLESCSIRGCAITALRWMAPSVLFFLCRLLKEQEEKENKIASLIAEQSDEK